MSNADKQIIVGISLFFSPILIALLSWFNFSWLFITLLSFFYFILVAIILDQRLAFFLILISRGSLDMFTDNNLLNTANLEINLASLWGGAAILLGLNVLIKNKVALQTLILKNKIILFLSIVCLSTIYSVLPKTSIIEFIRLLSVFSIYTAAFFLIKHKKDLILTLKIIIASAIPPSILGLIQLATNTGMNGTLEDVYNRAFGTFAHPNIFAYYLAFISALTIFFILRCGKNKISDVWTILVFPIFLFLLIFTYTRGAWLALAIALTPINLLKYRRLIVIGAIALFILYAYSETIQKRMNEIFTGGHTSLDWRIDLWKDAAKFSLEKPIIGFGAGTAKEIILEKRGDSFGSTDAHNDYIKIFIENGTLGLIAYSLLIFNLLKNIIILYTQEKDNDLQNFILLLFGAILALHLSITDNIMRQTALLWILWGITGGIFGTIKIENKKTHS